ncbi:hypothetical protein evm_001109 [Chilo suppressalis]|nr:hypothetical protein evm_001109 [Chilo suppressalis]
MAASRTVAVTQPERKSTHPTKKGSQDIPCATPTETRNRNCDEEGFITVERKKRKLTRRNLCGVAPIGPNNLLRPALLVTLLEINDINLGLLVEVWNKGVIWDRALGYHYLPLTSVAYNEQECGGRWIELEAQLMMRGGAVVGTTGPTGHALMLDCRFEPPFAYKIPTYGKEVFSMDEIGRMCGVQCGLELKCSHNQQLNVPFEYSFLCYISIQNEKERLILGLDLRLEYRAASNIYSAPYKPCQNASAVVTRIVTCGNSIMLRQGPD